MASLVPSSGKAIISGRMFGSASSTDVSTPASEARATGTSTQFTTTVTNDTHQVVGTLTANANKTITNVGIFDAAGTGSPPSGGVLYAIFDGLSQALNSGDSIQLTARVQYT
jgi:hypothetical protein